MRPAPDTALLAGAAAAAGTFVWLAIAVARRETKPLDHSLREKVPDAPDADASTAAEVIGPIGKDWLLVPLGMSVTGYMWQRGAGARAPIPAVAAVTAATGTWLFDEHLDIQRPPPGHPKREEPEFSERACPSHHRGQSDHRIRVGARIEGQRCTGVRAGFSSVRAVAGRPGLSRSTLGERRDRRLARGADDGRALLGRLRIATTAFVAFDRVSCCH